MTEAKLYTCHKQVMARPMTRGEYHELHRWPVPTRENPADEGYLVEYIDGGPANHADFKHYISWSPKAVFDKGYKPAPADFKERVIAEKVELDERIKKLLAFRVSDVFTTLPVHEQGLLRAQVATMITYSDLLKDRIELFKETPA